MRLMNIPTFWEPFLSIFKYASAMILGGLAVWLSLCWDWNSWKLSKPLKPNALPIHPLPEASKTRQEALNQRYVYKDINGRIAEIKRLRNGRCLLSLDGGGTRVLSQLVILHEISNRIERDLGLKEYPRLCDYFDVIGGVGTGGALALLIGRMGLTSLEAETELTPMIEEASSGKLGSDLFDSKLKAVVKKYTGNPEALMYDPKSPTSHCRTFVGAISSENMLVRAEFRSYETLEQEENYPIWQVARATLAYPGSFSSAQIGQNSRFKGYLSGQPGWSNPSRELLREFKSQWRGLKPLCFLSIGSGHQGVTKIDSSAVRTTLRTAAERIAADSQPVAEEMFSLFQGQNNYFRLNVEHGLQSNASITFEDVITHTQSYLSSSEVTYTIDILVACLHEAIEPFPWNTNKQHFAQTLDSYILNIGTQIDDINIDEVKLGAKEVLNTLTTIREVNSEEDQWLALAKEVNNQFRHIFDKVIPKLREPLSTAPLWKPANEYFATLKIVHENLKRLMKVNPYRIGGTPTSKAFLSRCIADLDGRFKEFQVTLIDEIHSQGILVEKRQQDKEFVRFLNKLSPLEPQQRHGDVRVKRVQDTGTWFLDTPEFRMWSDDQLASRALLGFGAPGAGKTILFSLAFEHIREALSRSSMGAACFYFDHSDIKNQTLASLIGGIAKQLIRRVGYIPTTIQEICRKNAASGSPFNIRDLQNILTLVISTFDQVYICFDALDECDPEVRRQLLRFIQTITGTPLRVFMTGRRSVEAEVKDALTYLSPSIFQIHANANDIRIVLSQMLSQDPYPEAMDAQLKEEIITKIVENAEGIFLLPYLQVLSILAHDNKRDRRLALSNIPSDAFDIYAITIRRIKQQRRERSQRALAVLTWVYLAEKPLQITELQCALAVKPGDTVFDVDGIPSEKGILDCCLGLVVVEAETLTVRLTHSTLREYLNKNWRQLFPSGHTDITTICITLLKFEKALQLPLTRYLRHNFGHHLRKGITPTVAQHALSLLKTNRNGILITYCVLSSEISDRSLVRPSTLQWVAYYGVSPIARLLLESMNPGEITDVNKSDVSHSLWLAVWNGHVEMVQLLLDSGFVDTNYKNETGETSLLMAVKKSSPEYARIVKILLSDELTDLECTDKFGRTPLSYSAAAGNAEVVRLLLEKGALINAKDKGGRTPFSWAISKPGEEILKLFMMHEHVDIDCKDLGGNTPFSYAADYCHEGLVRLLLETGKVDADSVNCDGRTPLSWAAEETHGGGAPAIVQMLLVQHSVDPNSEDKQGFTPLIYAAWRATEPVVQLLLQHGANVNHMTKQNETALDHVMRVNYNNDGRKERTIDLMLSYGAQRGQDLLPNLTLECIRYLWV